MDNTTFSLLPKRTRRLEKFSSTQLVTKQVFLQSRMWDGKLFLFDLLKEFF